jgi:hypothetical protein
VKERKFHLQDTRTSPEILPQTAGLDAQGFMFVMHNSALQDSKEWLTGDNIEKTYMPEIEKLACEVTGGRRVFVMDASFRLELADDQIPLYNVLDRGCVSYKNQERRANIKNNPN